MLLNLQLNCIFTTQIWRAKSKDTCFSLRSDFGWLRCWSNFFDFFDRCSLVARFAAFIALVIPSINYFTPKVSIAKCSVFSLRGNFCCLFPSLLIIRAKDLIASLYTFVPFSHIFLLARKMHPFDLREIF